MSAKWLRPTGTEKEYGRRPYISGKETSYVEMMQEVTDKARLDQGEFHLSEFKKPYLPGSYEQMEYQFSPVEGLTPLKPWRVDFPETTTTTTQQEDEYGSSTSTGSLRWKREPPAKGEADHWYLVEVWNRIRETSQTTNGKVTKYTKTYYPAWFEIRKTKANTKGFKLEVSLPNAVFDSQGSVRGFWSGGYAWYNVERQAGAIQAIVSYMWERGYSQPTMTAKLTLSAEATGEVEIVARDGKTTLRKKVGVEDRAEMFLEFFVMPNPPFYNKLSDYIAESPVEYASVTSTDSFLEAASTGFTVDTVDDGGDSGRPMETRTYTRTLKYLGEALEVCVEVQKWYYAWNGSAWVHDYHVFEGRRAHIGGSTYDYYLTADNAGTYLSTIESNTRVYLKYPDVAMFSLLGDDFESESYSGGVTTYLNNGSFYWSIHYKDEDNYLYIVQKYNNTTDPSDIYSFIFQGKQKGVAFNYEKLYSSPMPDGNVYIGKGIR